MLSSMTGFGAASGERDGLTWHFEVKSVNGRGLDIRLHLPTGTEPLEASIRSQIKAAVTRGNLQVSLNLRESREQLGMKINSVALNQLARKARLMDRSNKVRMSSTRAADLLAIKGVIASDGRTSSDISLSDACIEAIAESVDLALSQLIQSRKTEGAALHTVLERIISDLEGLVADAKSTADVQPDQIKARLSERVNALMKDKDLDGERLEQEVAILVSKADVTEELDRLDAHLEEARKLIDSDKAVGRKLDFLSQELLREANTLGSKSASLEMTRHSLSLKGLIDQFKEQAANVE
tara:strand:- start:216 stop:1106 length:891 start_codon:yes stop_codon:yes gene_type:complete